MTMQGGPYTRGEARFIRLLLDEDKSVRAARRQVRAEGLRISNARVTQLRAVVGRPADYRGKARQFAAHDPSLKVPAFPAKQTGRGGQREMTPTELQSIRRSVGRMARQGLAAATIERRIKAQHPRYDRTISSAVRGEVLRRLDADIRKDARQAGVRITGRRRGAQDPRKPAGTHSYVFRVLWEIYDIATGAVNDSGFYESAIDYRAPVPAGQAGQDVRAREEARLAGTGFKTVPGRATTANRRLAIPDGGTGIWAHPDELIRIVGVQLVRVWVS